jgi:predicted ATPase/class 3 adenylate cyclase
LSDVRQDLPTGTVTFLFTDVEGSTRLLHELGTVAYAEALAEHRRIVRSAAAAEGGVEVDTQGDAFFFAFPSAPGAIAASQAITEQLAEGPIYLRIGLHTGTPLVTDEGYVGDDVHLAARVGAVGHGGQVLISQATRDLTHDRVLTDLGEHRLKDIDWAVSIFQLGSTSFPPLRTISNTNLPRPASSFVGRTAEMTEVLSLLEGGARLLTLTGPGGSGKTRLALEAAATLVPSYKAGVFWVGLSALRDPALVTETIAQTLGARDGLAEHIHERELLLLLDNLEQVIDAAPELARLVSACPHLVLLCTSRERLRVQGEVEYEVLPLASTEAVSLFCQRSGLAPTEAIDGLCARLDSLPLAVELAAARAKALTPEQVLERLGQRLDLLKGGRDADPRQQTLRATVEWSYDLLPQVEQALFRRFSVFAGGCVLESAEEVCDAKLDMLQTLVEKSLIRFSDERYWMLETIREYAGERLAESGEIEQLHRRHALHFALVAETANEEWRGDRHGYWLARLASERENVRAAVKWTQCADAAEVGLRLAVGVSLFWRLRGPLGEGLRWLEHAVEAASDSPTGLRALALQRITQFRLRIGDPAGADHAAAASLALYRELEDELEVANALERVGETRAQLGDVLAAREHFSEALELLRTRGADGDLGDVLISSGYLELAQGNYERAAELFEEGVGRMRRTDRQEPVAYALLNLGSARLALGDVTGAETDLCESYALYRSIMEPVGYAYSVEALGVLKGRIGAHEDAALLLGAADRMFTENGAVMQSYELALHEATARDLNEALGAAAFADAWARGADLTDDGIGAVLDAPRRPTK